jgi:hypothetical protein
MVLLVIADHASDDGSNAYPSQQTIATKASISVRTAQRSINNLVKLKYIWRDKRAGGSANCREDRRPNLYTINLKMLFQGDNMSGRKERGDIESIDDTTPAPLTGRHTRLMNHPIKPPLEPSLFDSFWKIYPRHTAKGAAELAFKKALAKADAQTLIKALEIYVRHLPTDHKFIPHASTWLNQERWLDEPVLSPEQIEKQRIIERDRMRKEREAEMDRLEQLQRSKAVPAPKEIKDMFRRM